MEFDFEVKCGGGGGFSAFLDMKDPVIQGRTETTLSSPELDYKIQPLGIVTLKYKSGGLKTVITGSGNGTGSMRFGTAQSTYMSLGLAYNAGKVTTENPSTHKSMNSSLSKSAFKSESLTVNLELLATQNFEVSYLGITFGFDVNMDGTVQYQYGSSSSAVVTVRSGDDTARALRTQNHTSAGASYLNLFPGDVTVIRFEYSDFNPLEETVLFYSFQKSNNEMHPIMLKNFTSSSTGSGIFEASWSVPWDFVFAGEGLDNMNIIVTASNSILDEFRSESFGTTLFTDRDGIFSAPRAHESIPVETPYTLRWASALLHYFRPSQWGTGFGEEVQPSMVNFEVIAEKLFPNGSVQSSTPHRNLTQGPVPNTGEHVVIFPQSLLDTSDRLYIIVRAEDNRETAGWSKAYFKLKAKQGARPVFKPVPVLSSNKPALLSQQARTSHVATLPSTRNRDLWSAPSSRILSTCDPTQVKLVFKLTGGLAAKKISFFFLSFEIMKMPLTYETSKMTILPEITVCKTATEAFFAVPPIASSTDSTSVVTVNLQLSGFTIDGD